MILLYDLTCGTGTLATKLYEHGCIIYGQDFSDRMLELAQEKMPTAKLFQGDFSSGLVEPLLRQKYDAIVATYSLHHLTDMQKVTFLKSLFMLLNDRECIYIGDIAFESHIALKKCRNETRDEWYGDEHYFIIDELKIYFPTIHFKQISNCAGLISLSR